MKYTKIPAETFKELVLNAGILVTDFNPSTGAVSDEDIIGATQGGVSFTATPTLVDMAEDIDNCPKGVMEMMKIDTWEAVMSGTYVSANTTIAKSLLGAADVAGNKITPRADLLDTDFDDIWWVGDYSDKNTGDGAGFIAIHMMNALSTGGFSIQSGDKAKGQLAFIYTAHYSLDAQETVPFEIYIKAGA